MLYSLAKFVLIRKGGKALEIGTGRGFSTLWLAHAAKEVNAQIISLDNKYEHVDYARSVLREAGLSNYAEIVCMDEKNLTCKCSDITFIFINVRKDEYHKYLEAIEQRLSPGAIIMAHNTLSNAHEMAQYISRVYSKLYKSITYNCSCRSRGSNDIRVLRSRRNGYLG